MFNSSFDIDPEQQEKNYTVKYLYLEESLGNYNEHTDQQDEDTGGGSGTIICKSVIEGLIRTVMCQVKTIVFVTCTRGPAFFWYS